MALLLPSSVFFHIPKTGGTWVRSAIQEAGIPTCEVMPHFRGFDAKHCAPYQFPIPFRFSFAFVRHPLTWYQSYWCYSMKNERKVYKDFGKYCMSADFHTFIRNVLRLRPGYYGKMCKGYLGADLACVDFIGKQERLCDDLIQALRLAGESFDEAALRLVPYKNAAGADAEWRERAYYTRELAEAVCETDRHMFETFGYEPSLPDQPYVEERKKYLFIGEYARKVHVSLSKRA